jgi:glucose/arabinose dehydrogenase
MTRVCAAVLLLAVFGFAGCGGDGDGASTPEASGTAPPAGGSATSSPTAAPSAPLAQVAVERVFPALSFERLTGMYELPDGSGRFVVTEQAGAIRIFENRPDVSSASVFMDISARVSRASNEEGLLGLAFAPDFGRSGVFYVYYSARPGERRTVLSRFTASGDRSRADPASEQMLLEVPQPFPNHKGGQIAFGPDGFLYVGLGDGGSGNDPGNRAQNLSVLLGKILRIDVGGAGQGAPYRIPPDNPFAGRPDARPEVWAYGVRNPWRFSFDSANGDLWLGDVGQNATEEVDLVRRGQNYGWPQLEGSRCTPARGQACNPAGTVLPVTEYPTASPNCSVTGGFVYRAGRIASLQGAYVYGDYCSGKVWALRHNGSSVTEQMEVADTDIRISSFAMDLAGNIYALAHSDSGGGIYRISGR